MKELNIVLTVNPRKHIQSGFSAGHINSKLETSIAGTASVTYLPSPHSHMIMTLYSSIAATV